MAVLRAPVATVLSNRFSQQSRRVLMAPGGHYIVDSNRDATPDDLDGIKPDVLRKRTVAASWCFSPQAFASN
jgi:hypothetical protein